MWAILIFKAVLVGEGFVWVESDVEHVSLFVGCWRRFINTPFVGRLFLLLVAREVFLCNIFWMDY